jgi:hypothetical protein
VCIRVGWIPEAVFAAYYAYEVDDRKECRLKALEKWKKYVYCRVRAKIAPNHARPPPIKICIEFVNDINYVPYIIPYPCGASPLFGLSIDRAQYSLTY